MRALEGAIPDVAASRIITDVMAPNFRQNNYYQGISQALDKVFTLIEDAKLPAPQKKRSEANILYDPAEALWDEPWVAVLFIGFVIRLYAVAVCRYCDRSDRSRDCHVYSDRRS